MVPQATEIPFFSYIVGYVDMYLICCMYIKYSCMIVLTPIITPHCKITRIFHGILLKIVQKMQKMCRKFSENRAQKNNPGEE